MGDIGYRKKGETGVMYNPERDYAYITPTLMRIAIDNLELNDSPEVKAWREKEDVSTTAVVAAVTAIAKAQRDFVNSADPVNSFEQALGRHDFYNCSYPVRQYVLASIGEIFCAAWFTAVREVSMVGEESPAQNEMARFTAAVREFTARTDKPPYNHESLAERLQMRNNVLQTRIGLLLDDLKKMKEELAKSAKPAAAVSPPPQKRRAWFWSFGRSK
jgi:hypothetical protein